MSGVAAAGLVFVSAPASARTTDALIEGAKLCTRHLPRYERQYGIPVHLLSAISSTETGRWHSALKIAVPWPWTINAEGKGYYFDSKQEAIAAARKLQARGIRSMDVGCMQVNLVHHPDAFANLDYAFDPETNIAYAAKFLNNLYQESGSWKQAASHYHSKTPSLGQQYVSRVFGSWHKIIEKVRDARLKTQVASNGVPAQQPAAQMPEKSNVMNVAAGQTSLPTKPVEFDEASFAMAEQAELPPAPALPQRLSEQEGRNVQPHAQPHMRVIKIAKKTRPARTYSSTDDRREAGIIVVRPDVEQGDMAAVTALSSPNAGFDIEPYVPAHRDSTLTVADASSTLVETAGTASAPTTIAVTPQAASPVEPKVIDVDRESSRRRGPNFIFSN